MQRILFGIIFFSVVTGVPFAREHSLALAQLGPLSTNVSSGQGQIGYGILKLGAGGAVTGIDIQCDQGVGACSPGVGTVTKLSRNNAQGAHWFNPTITGCGNANALGCWQNIVTADSLPPGDPAVVVGQYGGAYEAVIAPSNTSHFWMLYNGYLYSSTNKGKNWAACNIARDVTANANGTASGGLGKHIAVDPANEWSVIVSTPTTGVSYSNGLSSACAGTWTTISPSSIPTSVDASNGLLGYLVAFDWSSTSGGSTPVVYVFSNRHGVYRTASGPSGSWTLTSGGTGTPTTFSSMVASLAGDVWVADGSSHELQLNSGNGAWGVVNRYHAGSWSRPSFGSLAQVTDIAINPNFPTRIYAVLLQTSAMYVSTDTGATWGGPTGGRNGVNNNTVATDIPWIAYRSATNGNSVFCNAGAAFDMSVSNDLYCGSGLGVFKTNPPTTSSAPRALTYTSFSAAIEELVINQLVAPAISGARPVAAMWDQCVMQPNATNYPSVAGVVNNTQQLQSGWAIDWASANPDHVVVICSGNGPDAVDGATSGISVDGGATWSKFPTQVSPNAGDFIGSISGTTLTVTSMINGKVGINTNGTFQSQIVFGASVRGSPSITAQGTGTGGVGTYTVSCGGGPCSTATSQTMYSGAGYIFGGCIAASSSTNILQVQAVGFAASGYPIWYTTDGGNTWHNPDSSLNTVTSSWFSSYQATFHSCAADRVDANTFYLYNISVNGSGSDAIYMSKNGGQTWTQQCKNCAGRGQGFGGPSGIVSGLKTAPGLSGYMCFSPGGFPGNNTSPHNFWCSTNHGVTWATSTNAQNVVTFGFGAVKPGNTGCGGSGCPSIYLAGQTNTSGNFVSAIWRSDDWGATWKNVGSIYPLGMFSQISDIDGDKNAWGTFYIGLHGQGAVYGKTNFLLNRDLDPASNDNSPVGIRGAA